MIILNEATSANGSFVEVDPFNEGSTGFFSWWEGLREGIKATLDGWRVLGIGDLAFMEGKG